MTAGKTTSETLAIPSPDSDLRQGTLKAIGGSSDDNFNKLVVNQAIHSLWLAHSDKAERDKQYQAAASAMIGIKPRDEIEGMLAAQMIATHTAAMECYRRAMIAEQSFEGRRENLNQANKLVRSYAALVEALDRHRGKGQQVVRVEHVTVEAGGQAIVGSVNTTPRPGGGGSNENQRQPHAIAHSPGEALPGAVEAHREAVPITRG